jgi:hypothetical protein
MFALTHPTSSSSPPSLSLPLPAQVLDVPPMAAGFDVVHSPVARHKRFGAGVEASVVTHGNPATVSVTINATDPFRVFGEPFLVCSKRSDVTITACSGSARVMETNRKAVFGYLQSTEVCAAHTMCCACRHEFVRLRALRVAWVGITAACVCICGTPVGQSARPPSPPPPPLHAAGCGATRCQQCPVVLAAVRT